jgi:integrase
VKSTHGCLHKALEIAVRVGCIAKNPTEACILPRITQKEITPLDTPDLTKLMKYLEGHEHEALFKTALFTGMRSGELLGLTWDCVDFQRCTLTVSKQLQKTKKVGGEYTLVSTKSGKSRIITVAPSVMEFLREEKRWQEQMQILAGSAWDNPWNLVFTNELGRHLVHFTVYKHFKEIVREIGMPKERFHDLRHSYAVVSIENGDDMKTVQTNLGHATSSFTLDVYGHVSQRMHQQSAERMERFIQSVTG